MSQEQSWGLGCWGAGQHRPRGVASSEGSVVATLAMVLSMLRGWQPQPVRKGQGSEETVGKREGEEKGR